MIKYEKNEIEGYELKSKNVTGGVGVNKFKLIVWKCRGKQKKAHEMTKFSGDYLKITVRLCA